MFKLNKIIFIILIVLSANAFAEKENLSNSVNALVKQYLPNSFVGISVKNCDGKTYYLRNADKYFTPASNTKLFTCTAAELFLGKDFKFTTAFRLFRGLINSNSLNGNLYIDFTGDPSYTLDNLRNNLTQLKNLGIKWIRGNIVIDDSVYSGSPYAQGISYEDVFYPYGVPPKSIILDRNIVKLEIQGGSESGDPAEILPGNQNRYFNIVNNIVTVQDSGASDIVDISADIDSRNRIVLNGSISANYKTEKEVPIKNPLKYVSDVLNIELKRIGISFDKSIITGKTPGNLDAVVVNTSAPLPELIKHTLKESDNLYADSLLKNMGMQRRGIGTYAEGLKVISQNMESFAGLNSENYKLYDGSGLSRYNLVTPNEIADLLVNIYGNDDTNQYIFNSLPVSGTDGTLENRMKNIPLKGKIKAKTGTMSGISALSGYVCFDKGRPVVFSILINNILDKDNSDAGKNFENALCKLLYDYFNDDSTRM